MASDQQQRSSLSGDDLVDGSDRIEDGYDRETGRSDFVAFLLGGVVIAGGLLGFLYYDGDSSRRDVLTTGSISQMEAPALVPSITVLPRQGSDGQR